MKKLTILLGLLVSSGMLAQHFSEVESEMKGFYYSSGDAADFDGDGFQDVVMNGAIDNNGDGNVSQTLNEIYKNNNGTLEFYGDLGLGSTHLGDIKFIDFDNDGLLDIISTGLSYNDIVNYQHYRFKNTGSGFEQIENLPGKIYGSLEVFDFNHDGLQDFALNGTQYVEGTGFTYDLDFYQNNGEGFDQNSAWLQGTQNGSFKIVDLNNDNLLDAVVFGFDADTEPIFKVYLNNNGTLEFSQDLDPVNDGKMAYADFNADGFLDLVVAGQDIDYNEYLAVLINDGTGNFTTTVLENEGLSGSSLDTGDLNNDGYYDFILIGNDADYNGWVNIFLYNPTDGNFEKAEETGLYNLGSQGTIKLFHLNDDQHLDVLMSGFDWADENMPSLTKLFQNDSSEENQKPLAPSELSLEQDGNKLIFNWSGASDDKTPTEALQYEIKVGTISGGQDIAKYVVTTPFWFLELEEIPENLFWSIKSIDASRVYSDSSVEEQLSASDYIQSEFIIYPNPASEKVYIKGNGINSIELYSLEGKKLDIQLNADQSMNVSNLPKGIYILKVQTENSITTKKLIIK